MSKHTPGPWHHDEYGHICAGPQIIGIAYQFELNDSDYDELPCIPNARLIAAAPVMFEELAHARFALKLASTLVPERACERFLSHSKHLGRMIELIKEGMYGEDEIETQPIDK